MATVRIKSVQPEEGTETYLILMEDPDTGKEYYYAWNASDPYASPDVEALLSAWRLNPENTYEPTMLQNPPAEGTE